LPDGEQCAEDFRLIALGFFERDSEHVRPRQHPTLSWLLIHDASAF
jgi:hypothetical protein